MSKVSTRRGSVHLRHFVQFSLFMKYGTDKELLIYRLKCVAQTISSKLHEASHGVTNERVLTTIVKVLQWGEHGTVCRSQCTVFFV